MRTTAGANHGSGAFAPLNGSTPMYSNDRKLVAVVIVVATLHATGGVAQEPPKGQGPSPKEYVERIVGTQLVPAGKLELDGRRMMCGRSPTVLDNDLQDLSAAYPKFTILNPRRLAGLPSSVKFWAYSVACSFQLRGPDPDTADCYAIRRGVQDAWLTTRGLKEICAYLQSSRKSGQGDIGGSQRCERLHKCLAETKRGKL